MAEEREWVVSIEFRYKSYSLKEAIQAAEARANGNSALFGSGGAPLYPKEVRIIGAWDATAEGA